MGFPSGNGLGSAFLVKMADLPSVVQAINDLVVRIERFNDPSEIGSIVLRLDYITRMLVNLDVADDIVNAMSRLHETVVAIEAGQADGSSSVGQGYQTQLNRTGGRGRPSFDITREQLSFLLEQGFKVKECSDLSVLGVGLRTVERRMSEFGLSVSGERFSFLFYSFDCMQIFF